MHQPLPYCPTDPTTMWQPQGEGQVTSPLVPQVWHLAVRISACMQPPACMAQRVAFTSWALPCMRCWHECRVTRHLAPGVECTLCWRVQAVVWTTWVIVAVILLMVISTYNMFPNYEDQKSWHAALLSARLCM